MDSLLIALQLSILASPLPDALYLAREAKLQGVPIAIVWSVAYQESYTNTSPSLRGHHCRGQPDCEIGRMQIKPSTARVSCRDLSITTYEGNVKCGIRILRALYSSTKDWSKAVRMYQCPKCRRPTLYEKEVMARAAQYLLADTTGLLR